jgi:cell division septum initiation protein DivIVA
VILFDEIEKANKDIFSTLLQMLDDGHLTDGLGRKINFKNCLIIMTSNIGVKKLQDFGTGVGFKTSNSSDVVQEEKKRDILKKELSKFFAPEFLNRIDDVVIFNSLNKDNIDKIVKLEIDILVKRLKSMKYNFTYEDSVIDLISKVGFDEVFGARPIKRAIQNKIEDLISEKILTGEVSENKEYMLFVKTENDEEIINIEERTKEETDLLVRQRQDFHQTELRRITNDINRKMTDEIEIKKRGLIEELKKEIEHQKKKEVETIKDEMRILKDIFRSKIEAEISSVREKELDKIANEISIIRKEQHEKLELENKRNKELADEEIRKRFTSVEDSFSKMFG